MGFHGLSISDMLELFKLLKKRVEVMENNEIIDLIISALVDQGIDCEIGKKLLLEDAEALMVKKELHNHDLVIEQRSERSRTNTSAITLTTKAINIFLDEEIVYLQSPNINSHLIRIDVELNRNNLVYLKRNFTGDFDIGLDDIINANSHIGIHAKENQKNQLYVGLKEQDSEVVNLFRSLLRLNDTLAIVRLKNGKYFFLGFSEDQLIDLEKTTYIEICPRKYFEDNEFRDESSDISSNDDITTINIDAYENASIDIDTTKECLVDLNSSNNLREIRKNKHSRLIAYFCKYLQSNYDYSPEENSSIDVIFEKDSESAVLCEIKTLNGKSDDERSQVFHAFAQLYYYKMYRLGKYRTKEKLHMLVIFDRKIGQKYLEFFENNAIYVIWYGSNGFDGTDKAKEILKNS